MVLADVQKPSRYWESIVGECDVDVTEITGTLPEDLVGTPYRNGSGRWNIGSSQVESIFDADGMVSAFVLDGSGVRFRNRFVRTPGTT
jgi:all-trans-8'-apo-beta-carotenal 15,15'-oxygenase